MTRATRSDEALSAGERAKCRALLEKERTEVLARIARHEAISTQTFEPLADELEQASVEADTGVVLQILAKERKLLREIEHALEKFEDDSYGLCEGTGEPIGAKRLLARPWARYSVAYKEELEMTERGYAR